MQVVISADEEIKAEWLGKNSAPGIELIWIDGPGKFREFPQADAYFDLSPEPNVKDYPKNKLVFINLVELTLSTLDDPNWVRINAWPGFLGRNLIEVACKDSAKEKARAVLGSLGWEFLFVEDTAGMIGARVVSMIINEAYFALGEGVSSKQEIDTAMKLGTNYPLGPFEWSEKIGLEKIYRLLKKLNESDERYEVAVALAGELEKTKVTGSR